MQKDIDNVINDIRVNKSKNNFDSLVIKLKTYMKKQYLIRALEIYLISIQAIFASGLPIANKFSLNYDRKSKDNHVAFDDLSNPESVFYFAAGMGASTFFSMNVIGLMQKEYDLVKDSFANKRLALLAYKIIALSTVFCAASFNSDNTRQGLKEVNASELMQEIMGWTVHFTTMLIYNDNLKIDREVFDQFKKCISGANVLYALPAALITFFRTFQMCSKMVTNIPADLDQPMRTIQDIKIASSAISFSAVTSKSFVKIRSPILNIMSYPIKVLRKLKNNYNQFYDEKIGIEERNPENAACFNTVLAMGVLLALFAISANAHGQALLADNGSDDITNKIGMAAVAICSFTICSSILPALVKNENKPSTSPNRPILISENSNQL